MENTSYALHIAVGVVIAIILTSLVLYVFNAMGRMEKSGDNVLVAQNKSEFNEAFLAFDKNLMYGTDVLSCLNKAQSNNQKYVYNNYYGRDNNEDDAREEYIIDVKVTLKNTIQESVKVYYRNEKGKIVEALGKVYNYYPFKITNNVHDDAEKFKLPTVNYYYFQGKGNILREDTGKYQDILWTNESGSKINNPQSMKLESKTYNTSLKAGEYSILNDVTGRLSALLTTVTTVEQNITNNTYNSYGNSNWYSATWKTATYDFKTRKFKCTGVTYNEDTGYINSISFEELVQ